MKNLVGRLFGGYDWFEWVCIVVMVLFMAVMGFGMSSKGVSLYSIRPHAGGPVYARDTIRLLQFHDSGIEGKGGQYLRLDSVWVIVERCKVYKCMYVIGFIDKADQLNKILRGSSFEGKAYYWLVDKDYNIGQVMLFEWKSICNAYSWYDYIPLDVFYVPVNKD